MNLTEFQIEAVVDTLEKKHNKFWRDKDKLLAKPVEKKDKDGLTKKEKDFLVAKNKRIREVLTKLPIEARIELQYEGSSWFRSYYKDEKGELESENSTLKTLIGNYVDGKEAKKYKKPETPKKNDPRIFKRAEVKRQVTMASIDSVDIAEILSKVGKKSNI